MTAEHLYPSLPLEFDPFVYRGLHPDVQRMSDAELLSHYQQYGCAEGRRSHALPDRSAFAALVPPSCDALEIGPFHWPLLVGSQVRYFDVLDRDGLLTRAREVGFPIERIPNEIHYVSPTGDLRMVKAEFDAVLSSHAIEHQPDLIAHLQEIERLLRPRGRYFVLVPDKNFCFDHFVRESTIADLLDSHHANLKQHTLRSQIEHLALTTHNDPGRHWCGDHGSPNLSVDRIQACLDAYVEKPDRYVDVHAWYFSPESFRTNMYLLGQLGYTGLQVERLYPTLRNANEFWAVLSRCAD